MKYTGRANTLLVELLLVILFFMFASVTLIEIFGAAKGQSNEAQAINEAVLESQNLAEELYDAAAPETVLKDYGFSEQGDAWQLSRDQYELHVTVQTEEYAAGTLKTWMITSVRGEKVLSKVPSARYLPKEATP